MSSHIGKYYSHDGWKMMMTAAFAMSKRFSLKTLPNLFTRLFWRFVSIWDIFQNQPPQHFFLSVAAPKLHICKLVHILAQDLHKLVKKMQSLNARKINNLSCLRGRRLRWNWWTLRSVELVAKPMSGEQRGSSYGVISNYLWTDSHAPYDFWHRWKW